MTWKPKLPHEIPSSPNYRKSEVKKRWYQDHVTDDHFGLQLLLFVAHVAFYPLAFFTFLPEASRELWGADYSLFAGIGFVLASLAVISGKGAGTGRLNRWGSVIIVLGMIVMVPLFFGGVIFILLSFATGGLESISLVWKGVLMSLFYWWYLSS